MWTMAARAGKRSAIELEASYFDVDTVNDLTSTGAVAVVNAMAQGTNYNQRQGNRIVLDGLEWTFRVSNEAPVTAGKSQTLRLMFLYDHQPNLALAAITDILDTAAPNSFLNLSNRERFTVLQDKLLVYNGGGFESLTAAGIVDQTWKGFVDLQGYETSFVDGTGAIGSLTTGAVLVLYVGCTAAGTVDFDAVCKTRLIYYS